MRTRDRYILATLASAAILGAGIVWQNWPTKQSEKEPPAAVTHTLPREEPGQTATDRPQAQPSAEPAADEIWADPGIGTEPADTDERPAQSVTEPQPETAPETRKS